MPGTSNTSGYGKALNFDDFTVAEIQAILNAVDMVGLALGVTDSDEDFRVKVQISTLVFECAESGERDLKSLVAYTLNRVKHTA